jgi:hypothetical protein
VPFLDPPLAFDKAKPFYPLVVAALAQFHGLIEIVSRALFNDLGARTAEEQARVLAAHPESKARLEALLGGGLTSLIGKQKHLAPLSGQTLKVDVNALGLQMVADHNIAFDYFDRMAAGSLLVLAWETTKGHHTHDELWEFLRHCRNAAAHNGAFHLVNGEPKRRAAWRGHVVEAPLHGSTLFADPPKPGFMGPGDAFYLLADIEAKLL